MKDVRFKLSMTVHNNDPQLAGLQEAAEILSENDFWGIEPDIRDSRQIDGQQLGRIVADCGLQVPALATGRGFALDGLSLSDPNRQKRKQAIELLKGHMDLASELKTNVIIGLLRGIRDKSDPEEDCLNRLAESLKVCGDDAEQQGCKIFFEAINHKETNIAPKAQQAVMLIEAAGSSAIKLLLDTYHLDIEENSPADVLDVLRKYVSILGHFHLADRNRKVPGTAGIDFGRIMKELLDLGYKGTVTVEIPLKPDAKTCIGRVRTNLNRMGIYSA